MTPTEQVTQLHAEALDRLTERARLLGRAEVLNELRRWVQDKMNETEESVRQLRQLDIKEWNKALEAL